jgi:hypothetical protein
MSRRNVLSCAIKLKERVLVVIHGGMTRQTEIITDLT